MGAFWRRRLTHRWRADALRARLNSDVRDQMPTNGRGSLVMLLAISGCTLGPHYSLETDYPGTAVGVIELRRDERSRPAVLNRDGTAANIPVVVGPVVVPVSSAGLFRTPSAIRYEIRASDGTVLLVDVRDQFQVGDCVRVSGYADGPSRTHWSLGRAKLESSKDCVK